MEDEEKLGQEEVDELQEQLPDGGETGEESSTEQQADTVPLKTHLAAKKQLKELKRQIAEFEQTKYDQDLVDYKVKTKSKYLEAGYDETLADMLAGDLASIREVSLAKRGSQDDEILDEDIEDLAQSDEFYADAVQYRDDIKKKIKDFKKKKVDLSVEDAYALVSNVKRKTKELGLNATQREIIRNKTAGSSANTNVPTASGTGVKQQYKLDADDRKALAELQKAQPSAEWTPEKYYKYIKQ